jgi:hypothetical protein
MNCCTLSPPPTPRGIQTRTQKCDSRFAQQLWCSISTTKQRCVQTLLEPPHLHLTTCPHYPPPHTTPPPHHNTLTNRSATHAVRSSSGVVTAHRALPLPPHKPLFECDKDITQVHFLHQSRLRSLGVASAHTCPEQQCLDAARSVPLAHRLLQYGEGPPPPPAHMHTSFLDAVEILA